MMKKTLPAIFSSTAIFLLIFMAIPDVSAAGPGRDRVIRNFLDCTEQYAGQTPGVDYNDVCYLEPDARRAGRRQAAIRSALDEASVRTQEEATVGYGSDILPDDDYTVISGPPYRYPRQEKPPAGPVRTAGRSDTDSRVLWDKGLGSWELATEVYGYGFDGPASDVHEEGAFTGLSGSYTFRNQENGPVNSLRDLFTSDSKPNMFRLGGRLAFGNVSFQSQGYETDIEPRDWTFEISGVLGYEIPAWESWLFTPYFGLGFKYLGDGMDDIGASTHEGTNFYSGYKREFKYLYLPLGLEAQKTLDADWSVKGSFEFDVVLSGQQTVHLQDMDDVNGANAGYSQLENDFDGFGLRTAVRVIKSSTPVDFFAEPFFRYWNVSGEDPSVACASCIGGFDPEHTSAEYGLKMGVQYR